SECNQAIVRAEAEPALLQAVCRILVEPGGYRMAWVGYAEADGQRRVWPMAMAGHETAYVERNKIGWADDDRGQGPAGKALRSGVPQVNRDSRSNPDMAPWRVDALACGFLSSIAIPLKGETAPLGLLAIYAAELDAFDTAEVRLLNEVGADLAFGIAALRVRSARQRAEEMVARLAYFDSLTGLPNRTQLLERMVRAITGGDGGNGEFALLTINVNRFDDIQIGLGVELGDEALKQLGARLGAALDKGPFLARLGGDIFGVLLERCNADCARATADRILLSLAEPFPLAGILVEMQASVGAALYPAHGSNCSALLLRSNIAARQARNTGAGYALYTGITDAESPRQLALVSELRRAIGSQELVLHYQPKVDLRTGRVAGAEALVRWQHPERGLLLPAEFIPAAERTGLIRPLTDHVIDSALGQTRRWSDRGLAVRVAVNISPSSLRDPEFVRRVIALREKWGTEPASLQFEITESTLMEDPARSHDVLMQLRDCGISIFIDDFGTGYSSLSYIATLPIHGLKIDRSFIAGMLSNAQVRTVIEATISLARTLEMQVVAEGVETREQAEELARMGCDELQGFHFGRPMLPEELEELAAASSLARYGLA
ncbi:MAG TPA: EAL domain-containing protein, partial [Usitatibacteraceae bacterium]|nr:EAL domain-containing protein [Usitatibacteraceae bacterium]